MPARRDSEGSVYQVRTGPDTGKWRGAIVVGWKPDGQPDRKTVKRATEQEARKALRGLLADRDRGRLTGGGSGWTVEGWCWHWLEDVRSEKGDLAPGTWDRYASLIRSWVAPTVGKVRLDRVRDEHGAKLQTAMRRAGLSASSRRQAHVVLDQALDEAVRRGLLGFNPVANLKPPPVVRPQIHPPSDEDCAAIYQAILGDRNEARWIIALSLGLRQGEALGLAEDRIDLTSWTLTVTHQLRRLRGRHGCARHRGEDGRWPCGRSWASGCPTGVPGGLALVELKSANSKRTVPVPGELRDVLRAHLTENARERLMFEERRPWRTGVDGRVRDVDLVFAQPITGRPVEPHDDWEAWHAVLVRAGLEQVDSGGRPVAATGTRLHNARHAAVVGMIDGGVPLETITRLVGHASHAFTNDTYGHWSKEQAQRAESALADRLARLRRRPDLKRRESS